MTGNSFATRVQTLRDSWIERRQVRDLAGAHDFDSQYLLLLTLHGWAREGADDITAVYDGRVPVTVSAAPFDAEGAPAFTVTIADGFWATFALAERHRMGGSRWFVGASITTAGSAGTTPVGSAERRNGQWTRSRLEEVLLTVLRAYERSFSDREPEAVPAKSA